jgi:hypothetical protein
VSPFWQALWQGLEIAAVGAWALVVVLMLLPKRRTMREDFERDQELFKRVAEVGGSRPVPGAVQPRHPDASAGGLPGEPSLPPSDEGFA